MTANQNDAIDITVHINIIRRIIERHNNRIPNISADCEPLLHNLEKAAIAVGAGIRLQGYWEIKP